MKKIHFIAIGGSVMHNLAINLLQKGYKITGSDDEFYEPSKSNLRKNGILPREKGWFRRKIVDSLDFIILGMHAKKNNPELIEALKKKIKIYSYPEFVFDYCKQKTRIVIAGSHGKTTITSMILHVLKKCDINFDYLVGANIEGFENMVSLSDENEFVVIEGDEYYSSAIDSKSKFFWYKPNITLISGIDWDHINIFPTNESYINQFKLYVDSISKGGIVVYYENDLELKKIIDYSNNTIKKIPYCIENSIEISKKPILKTDYGDLEVNFFGDHNLENLAGARWVCQLMGVESIDFYESISTFKGASRRLEIVYRGFNNILLKDFAHSPSKVRASCKSVDNAFPNFKKIYCLELHTFSSLDINFIKRYSGSMDSADEILILYDKKIISKKNKTVIDNSELKIAFGNKNLEIYTSAFNLCKFLYRKKWDNSLFLFMSSANYGGISWDKLVKSFSVKK